MKFLPSRSRAGLLHVKEVSINLLLVLHWDALFPTPHHPTCPTPHEHS
uniref:Uncharacterized protein n=1 Tax=Rhizophora mucronata TaxID=61149 RepID=A0A2P2N7A3_RHIMU